MKTLQRDGVTLAFDGFGDRRDPTVLLIAGATQSMDWWTPEFCERLAGEALHVVRYDHRDCGQSTTGPAGAPAYSAVDLATDPLRILNHLDVPAAHLVGLSMGGGIAQYLAVHAPDRVRSVTLIESSPAGGRPGELPPSTISEEPDPALVDWSDGESVLHYRVEAERPYAGSLGFNEERTASIAAREIARSVDMESMVTNHFLVAGNIAVDPREFRQPALVIHSSTDPLFPIEHGEALERMIPKATLLRLDGMGHEVPPPPMWEVVIPAIARHVRSAGR